jgi:hypothetical protein
MFTYVLAALALLLAFDLLVVLWLGGGLPRRTRHDELDVRPKVRGAEKGGDI